MGRIRKRYGVPAKRGGRIIFRGAGAPLEGRIVSARGNYLRIQLDGQKFRGLYHPTWELEYL